MTTNTHYTAAAFSACRRLKYPLMGLMLYAGLSGCGENHNTTTGVEPEPVGGPALMRKLTESQYRATVADIFGSETQVVARFERDLRAEGLQAIGSSEAGISPFSIEQFSAAAMSVAEDVLSEQRRANTVPCSPSATTEFDEQCAIQFVDLYGPQLLRRPLTPEQRSRFVNEARISQQHLGDFYQGLKFALVGIMTSPEFLLRIERTASVETDREQAELLELDPYSKAERLSYFLTNSAPDPELFRAATAGELDTASGLAYQVDRLIATESFEEALRAFFSDMLEFELFADLTKDISIYPTFNSQVAVDAQEQTLRDITRHLIDNNGDYRDLFTLRETALTRSLSVIYRIPVRTRNGWEVGEFPENGPRAGIQNHISFLALHAHPGRSSPSLRGAAVREIFLCQEVPDPPADVDFSAVQDASQEAMPTARDRLAIHNSEAACSGCHKIMDPPGLGMENFDGVGGFRTRENGAVIDPSGILDGIPFETPRELSEALRNHRETPRCLAEKMYRFAVGRDTVWDERTYMDYLIEGFINSGYHVPSLMRDIALSENFFAITPNSGTSIATAVSKTEGEES